MTIQYDGSDFHGWQMQAKGRTVQGDIEDAISVIYPGEKITLIGAGRTDAGVHALGQAAHITLPSKHTAAELQKALNGNLKQDVCIDMVEDADDDFHARFSATSREYEYHMVKHYCRNSIIGHFQILITFITIFIVIIFVRRHQNNFNGIFHRFFFTIPIQNIIPAANKLIILTDILIKMLVL